MQASIGDDARHLYNGRWESGQARGQVESSVDSRPSAPLNETRLAKTRVRDLRMKQIVHEPTPAAYERELRWLRFKDRVVERAFQEYYARLRVPQFKIAFWIGILIQIPAAIRFRFVLHIGPTAWWQIILSRWQGVVPAVIGLLLCRWERAAKWLPIYMVLYVLYLGQALMRATAQVPIGWTTLSTILVAFCIMARLRAREALLVEVFMIGWYAYATVVLYHRPAAFLATPLVSLGTLAIFILAANYLIEHSARRDFLLLRLLGQEREKTERLLLNVLPEPIAERLKKEPGTIADRFEEITVLFADIVDSTPHIARMDPEDAVELLNDIFTAFDRLAATHGLEKIKTVGDSYMVVGGLPEPRKDHAEAVVAMALDMQEEIAKFTWPGGEPVVLRVGINTGPAVAGVIGTSKFIYDLWGDTVNVASRMESHGIAGQIQLTQTTYRRVREHHRCAQRTVNVKGKGQMSVYMLQRASVDGARRRTVRRKAVVRT